MRFALVALFSSLALPVAAQDMKQECAIQGEIIQALTEQRLQGVRKARAERVVRSGLSDEAAKYETVLPNMVDFIYMMVEPGQLDAQTGKVWETQCLAAAQ